MKDTHTDTHTHTHRGKLWLRVREGHYAWPYPFRPVRFTVLSTSLLSPAPAITSLSAFGFLPCLSVCVLWIRKGSGCQGTRACGILRRLASHGAMGAQVLGKSPAEVKSAVTEMKGGSPAATPPTDLRVKNEKGSRRLWEVRPEEVFLQTVKSQPHLVSICLTFEILITDGVCV